jgi:hypothetical protein
MLRLAGGAGRGAAAGRGPPGCGHLRPLGPERPTDPRRAARGVSAGRADRRRGGRPGAHGSAVCRAVERAADGVDGEDRAGRLPGRLEAARLGPPPERDSAMPELPDGVAETTPGAPFPSPTTAATRTSAASANPHDRDVPGPVPRPALSSQYLPGRCQARAAICLAKPVRSSEGSERVTLCSAARDWPGETTSASSRLDPVGRATRTASSTRLKSVFPTFGRSGCVERIGCMLRSGEHPNRLDRYPLGLLVSPCSSPASPTLTHAWCCRW